MSTSGSTLHACEGQHAMRFDHIMGCGMTADYVDFLRCVTPDNQDEYIAQMRRFNLGPVGEADCPVFDGMFDYCSVRRSPPPALMPCLEPITYSQSLVAKNARCMHAFHTRLQVKLCCKECLPLPSNSEVGSGRICNLVSKHVVLSMPCLRATLGDRRTGPRTASVATASTCLPQRNVGARA